MNWILVKDRLPEKRKDGTYDNVFTWCNGQLCVMCLAFMRDDDNNLCLVWCNCHGYIDGDGEFDDNYEPTHWMPLPEKPEIKYKFKF